MPFERHALFWIAAAVLLAVILHVLSPVLLPFAAGLTIAYFLNPIVDGLTAAGLPRGLATALLTLLLLLLIVAVAVFVAPVVAEQAQQLAAALPSEMTSLKKLLEEIARERLGPNYPEAQAAFNRTVAGMSDSLPALAASIAQSLWSGGSAAFGFLSLLLVTPLVAFYALLDWPKIIAKIDSWLPRQNAETIRMLAREIDGRVSAFIRGQGIVCLALASFYALALSALGLKYGLLVGLLTGLMSFIPFAGWALGLIAGTTLALIQFWPDMTHILLVPAVFCAGQVLDAALLSPKVIGTKIGLHPVWLIFALLVFSYLFGFLGLLVAVPVAAAIGVLVRYGLERYMASAIYAGQSGQL
jgi:predicted PurR-regulated permease PerM